MGLQKRILKSRPVCKVTFHLPKEVASDATSVNLVGEFNEWDKSALPMKRLKSGDFKVTLDLSLGKEYQFRYLISRPGGSEWENDGKADKYVPSGINSEENSVLIL